MIKYDETEVGDILRVVGAGAPGTYDLGELVRVTEVHANSVTTENRDGKPCEFLYNCGAARLEPTEWKKDFPSSEGAVEMASSVRAKFKVSQVSEEKGFVELQTVYDPNPESENGQFFKYTPAGSIQMSVVNEAALKQFEVDKEYYVDFTPAG